jgi:glycosyltransferase involved in cell wall biosynthesis
VVLQPDVYPFAARLARFHGCPQVIALGCRVPGIEQLRPEFRLIELEPQPRDDLPLPEGLPGSVIVCAGLIDHLRDPTPLLRNLRRLLDEAPLALLTATLGYPALEERLRIGGLRVAFSGLTTSDDEGFRKLTRLALLESPTGPVPAQGPAPPGFRVVGLMPTFNEEDVVESSIRALAADGVETYVLDNWSTDETPRIVEQLLGEGVAGLERFPPGGAGPRAEWRRILERTEQLASTLEADWFLHVDADERPKSPWPSTSLRDALWYVDRCNFNCVDQTTITFHPVDDGFCGQDLEAYFRFFDFGQDWGAFHQVKAWKNLGVPASRAHAGGHETAFEGRRVYPYKFLLRHYPIRSQAHGERKVHSERLLRWSREEREAGWHIHYDGVAADHRFVRDPAELLEYEEELFNSEYLVERLSGIGIPRLGRPSLGVTDSAGVA